MSHGDVLTRTACLVRYGRLGWVALFSGTDELVAKRGDRVVIQTERGQELGELLSNVAEHLIGDVSPAGDVLRLAGDDDGADDESDLVDLDELIGTIRERDTELEPVDAELLVDGRTAVIYCLGEVGPESERIAVELSKRTGRDIRLSPMFDPEPGRCGSGGGGCGSGGCGSGQADE
jgi:cell fate regulator YaaT (PSP1 superfamily)